MRIHVLVVAALLGAALASPSARAHGGPGVPVAIQPGLRSVTIEMDDSMRYRPSVIHAKRGEALRIVGINHGRLAHEIVLGTREELEAHRLHMREHPGMVHDDPNMMEVPPGATREMGWRFTSAGDFLYGCLMPGHYEAGMVGKIVVEP